MNRVVRLWALVPLLAFTCATMLTLLPGGTASASPARTPAVHRAHSKADCTESYGGQATGDTWSATEPLHRTFHDAGGQTSTSNCFKLAVDKHTDMQDHERITVKWSGAHVTNGRSLNPYGESGLPQEYPVVLMECRTAWTPRTSPAATVPSGHEAVSL